MCEEKIDYVHCVLSLPGIIYKIYSLLGAFLLWGLSICRGQFNHFLSVSLHSPSLFRIFVLFFIFFISEFYPFQDNLHILPTGGVGKSLQWGPLSWRLCEGNAGYENRTSWRQDTGNHTVMRSQDDTMLIKFYFQYSLIFTGRTAYLLKQMCWITLKASLGLSTSKSKTLALKQMLNWYAFLGGGV